MVIIAPLIPAPRLTVPTMPLLIPAASLLQNVPLSLKMPLNITPNIPSLPPRVLSIVAALSPVLKIPTPSIHVTTLASLLWSVPPARVTLIVPSVAKLLVNLGIAIPPTILTSKWTSLSLPCPVNALPLMATLVWPVPLATADLLVNLGTISQVIPVSKMRIVLNTPLLTDGSLKLPVSAMT